MFLNYLAGAVSLVLAVSAFIPWVTVWFYSLMGIESIYGIIILVVGLLGLALSVFQHLSGKARGRGFIVFSVIAMACETLYFRKIATYGSRINEVVALATDLLGDTLVQKLQHLIGEQWTKVAIRMIQKVGMESTVSEFDFLGGGLILAAASALALLILGILLEQKKPELS